MNKYLKEAREQGVQVSGRRVLRAAGKAGAKALRLEPPGCGREISSKQTSMSGAEWPEEGSEGAGD